MTNSNINQTRKKVFALACQLAKHINNQQDEMTFTWSQILQIAWLEVKMYNYRYVEFYNTKNEICKRVVLSANWSDTHTVKGTGTPTKPGQKLYTDAAKQYCGMTHNTGSYYESNLIQEF